ncbi:hypothetical protein OS175_10695 [Marinicella sp. S1101]|uniref:hypothetical protein n=1 Tax=Marinicella marina TaxID=2996016 RepID=UPI0022609C02|nr:hypothetical protein [Marinicella marina]MCX7554349.1 hypothetical protein [Marinicella marina]MDJ1138660.1 hypothetical protein [Marinicella marina]
MKTLYMAFMMMLPLTTLAEAKPDFNHQMTDTGFDIQWQQTGDTLYFSQSYKDQFSGQQMVITKRIDTVTKNQNNQMEVSIFSDNGFMVFKPTQLVDEMLNDKSTGEKSEELQLFLSVVHSQMVADVNRQLTEEVSVSLKRGACSAATSYVAFTWNQFMQAVIAGNNGAANYWMFENQWAISEMRIFCEIR